ncbi:MULTISPECIES: HipA N-terminal domain-containing protein [unclassified Halomonas]|uniref:HipA N-terminal domain-containing protein n=1 Tax=unclassified Halomonas TaxID=2609666 RepID=UPI0007D92FA9|nr:HipA N-terminal domain-containing protein [Halomonas sp. ALS9]MBT2785386.1 HipA N-terminal domain-containing protein [Halomonas sp. ISL-106]MBT2799407.1 HipA N-terminal domain-containing protein [Halomonas sp. ISL-104]OAL59660.1 hypothetical protein A6R74_03225 [Halomonas sp. ALS9]
MRKARVYYKGRYAGLLQEDEEGLFQFSYDALYRIDGYPIAFSIPLSAEPYVTQGLPPFFENLVSEGWLRRVQSTTQRIDENDSFGLLLLNGRDLIGAVSVLSLEDHA